jgi:hypothetical protein
MSRPKIVESLLNPIRSWIIRLALTNHTVSDVRIAKLERKVEIFEKGNRLNPSDQNWIISFVEALQPRQFTNLPLGRVGSQHDGGYVLPLGLVASGHGVISIGVGDDNVADIELASMGLTVHAWDHTIDALPTAHPNIHFHKIGLGSHSNSLLTLDEIITTSFGSDPLSITLLLDAEGAEWEALLGASDFALSTISVIAVEFHELGQLLIDPTFQMKTLERMNKHFVPIAIHPNNHGAEWQIGDFILQDVIEVTYVNRSLLTDPGHRSNCPAELLSPCCAELKDSTAVWIIADPWPSTPTR